MLVLAEFSHRLKIAQYFGFSLTIQILYNKCLVSLDQIRIVNLFFFLFEKYRFNCRVARLDHTVDYKLLGRNVSIALSRNEKGETQPFRYMGTVYLRGS